MERVGEARLAQDAQIQSQFLAGWNTTLNTNLQFASRARKNVEKSRLSLDAVKAHAKGTTWKLPTGQRGEQSHDDQELSPEAQEEVEKAEDEFVTQTEEAFGVMKNVRSVLYGQSQSVPCLSVFACRWLTSAGSGHPRAAAQPVGADRCPGRVLQEGIRNAQRAGTYY